jgi:predicted component of type VI protein secretion system
MAYIVVNSQLQDVDCRELDGGLVIGRAPDCQVSVRDILLSRRHCRIEKTEHGWLLIDLNSKNGTALNGQRVIAPMVLNDRDIVQMGQSRLVFREGYPDPSELAAPAPQRPSDPNEALAGTLAGFTFISPENGEGDTHLDITANQPVPQPKPRDPAAYEREELHVMLTAIASSSWDSIYAEARQPRARELAAAPSPAAPSNPLTRPSRPRSPIDLSLQANPPPMMQTVVPPTAAPVIDDPIGRDPDRYLIRAMAVAAAIVWIVAGVGIIVRSAGYGTSPNSPVNPAVDMQPAAQTPAPVQRPMPELSDADSWTAAKQVAMASLPAIIW